MTEALQAGGRPGHGKSGVYVPSTYMANDNKPCIKTSADAVKILKQGCSVLKSFRARIQIK